MLNLPYTVRPTTDLLSMKRTVLWQSLGVVTMLTMIQAPLLQTLHPLTTSVSVGDNWSQSPHKHKHWAACLKVPDDFPPRCSLRYTSAYYYVRYVHF